MAEINPPFALQNAGAVHTAENDRMTLLSGMVAGIRTAGSLVGRGGVHPMAGGLMAITQTGTASMNLQVASGICYVSGSEGSKQGLYGCVNDATDTVTITAAHGTLPRIDCVVARVYDSAYSGASNTWALEVVTGTAASSPVAPALPANTFKLADVNVGAGVTSITTANIVDRRSYVAGVGGTIIVKDSAERDALTTLVPNGQLVYRTDTGMIEGKHGGQWYARSPQTTLKQSQLSSPAFTVNGVWNDWPGANWPALSFTAPRSGAFTISIGAQLTTGPTHAIWVGYRLSGGLVQAANGGLAIGATAGTYAYSKELFFEGATPGASVTLTPQYQIQSGSTGHSIQFGQYRIHLEP